MKIISLGLDQSALTPSSGLAKRLLAQSQFLTKYLVFVPSRKDEFVALSDKVAVSGLVESNKIVQWFRLYARLVITARRGFDIITVQDNYYLAFLAWLIAWRYDLKLEIQIHGFEKGNFFRRLIFAFNIKRADGIRVVSQRLKQHLIDNFKISEFKIYIIPVYSSYPHTVEGKKDYLPHDPFVFFTVARLVPVKNISLQIKAMAGVVKRYPNVVLKIAGDGPEKNKLQQLVRGLNLQDKVIFLGQVREMRNLYKSADVFLLTSTSEGWGLVVVEAASFGLPIIMTDVGCAGEVILDQENGLIVDSNEEELVAAMAGLMLDEKRRESLGSKAKEAVSNLPTEKENLILYKESWERLI